MKSVIRVVFFRGNGESTTIYVPDLSVAYQIVLMHTATAPRQYQIWVGDKLKSSYYVNPQPQHQELSLSDSDFETDR